MTALRLRRFLGWRARTGPANVAGARTSGGWSVAALSAALLVALPLLAILVASVGGDGTTWRHLAVTTLSAIVANSIGLMAMTGALALGVGTGCAWLVTMTRMPGRRLVDVMLIMPLAVPAYILAYVYADLLAFAGPVQSALRGVTGWQAGDYGFPAIRSLPGAAIILALALYPYVYLMARAAFRVQSRSQFRAARTLGMRPARAFWRVALPGARPAIAGGLALVLMEVLADFGVADYFAIPTFSTGIFRSWLAMGDRAAAMQLAGVMLLVVMMLVWFEAAVRRGRTDSRDPVDSDADRLPLSRRGGAMALAACLLPPLLGVVVPVAVLLGHALDTAGPASWPSLWRYAFDSLQLAAVVALAATLLALLLAYAQRQSKRSSTNGAIRLATLGYALPGAMLAVGLLGPLGAIDRGLTGTVRDLGIGTSGLVLAGSGAILVYALVVRFLTVSFNGVSAAMQKIPVQMDAAARSLGARPGAMVRRVHLPQLGFALAASGALVFIDTLRELPATLILRPFNLETLATRVYRLASDEKLAEASSAALLIVLAGLVPVLILVRMGKRHSY